MPRRSGGGGGGGFGSRSSGSRSYSSRPASPPAPVAPKQPGLFKRAAATAGGVAAGTVLGHALIGALSPSERRDHYESTYARASPQQLNEDPCGENLSRLISCMRMAQEANVDVTSVCSQAENFYLECRKNNGDPTY